MGFKEGETQNGHITGPRPAGCGARRRGGCFEFPSSFGNFYVFPHVCENFSLEKQSTFRIAAYFYVYPKQVGFNRAPLNPTCCEISAEPNFRYTTILSRVLSTSVLNQLVFAFSSAEPNFRYTTIPCTCNLVAAYIIPSVFLHFLFFPNRVYSEGF